MRRSIALVAASCGFIYCGISVAQIQICDYAPHCKPFSAQEDGERYVQRLLTCRAFW